MMMMEKCRLFGICLIILILGNACNADTKELEQLERDEIETYLAKEGNENFIKKESGLYYHETEIGYGNKPIDNDTVYVNYKGKCNITNKVK